MRARSISAKRPRSTAISPRIFSRCGGAGSIAGCAVSRMAPSATRRCASSGWAAARGAADLEVAGPVELRLWVACETPDADIHAKLVDVHPPSEDYPQGFAMNLSEGLLRLRYRDSCEHPSPMSPGAVYQVTIALFPT